MADEKMGELTALMSVVDAEKKEKAAFAEQWYRYTEPELNTLLLLCRDERVREKLMTTRGFVREYLGEART